LNPTLAFKHWLRHPYAILPGAPKGIITDARAWVKRQIAKEPVDLRRGPGSAYWEDRSLEIRPLPRPKSALPDCPCPPVWRVMITNRTALFRLMGCRVIGREGTVISSDNRVFAEFTYVDAEGGIDPHPIFQRRRFPPAQYLPGTYATITYPSSFAYYHWIAESLPRLKLLEPFLSALDGLFIPDDIEPQMTESLLAFGLQPEQLIPLSMASHYCPQVLMVPEYCAGLNIPEWAPQYLKQRLAPSTEFSSSARRLYISRQDAGKRRVINEGELLPILERYGFEVICLRSLSFVEQVKLFSEAEIVVGPHGAGLANLMFCSAGVKVLELVPSPDMPPFLFYSITTAVDGDYWWLPGEPSSQDQAPIHHRNFSLQPEKLSQALKTILCQ